MSLRTIADGICTALDPGAAFPHFISGLLQPYFFDPFYSRFEKAALAVAPASVADLRKYAKDLLHPDMAKLPMADPLVVAYWLAFYFVLLAALLPIGKFLSWPGQGLKLRLYTISHSAFLAMLSLYMGVSIFSCAYADNYSFANNAASKDGRIQRACWIYCISKIPEFWDSFIHAVRGNSRGLSFLHVYHHSSILVFVYVWAFANPGGDCYLSSGMNSAPIHFVMYTFFALTAFAGSTAGPLRAFLDKYKYSITVMQIVQFTLNMCASIYVVFVVPPAQVKFPVWAHKLMIGYMLTMIVLFTHFLLVNTGGGGKREGGGKGKKGAAAVVAAAPENGAAPASPAAAAVVAAEKKKKN